MRKTGNYKEALFRHRSRLGRNTLSRTQKCVYVRVKLASHSLSPLSLILFPSLLAVQRGNAMKTVRVRDRGRLKIWGGGGGIRCSNYLLLLPIMVPFSTFWLLLRLVSTPLISPPSSCSFPSSDIASFEKENNQMILKKKILSSALDKGLVVWCQFLKSGTSSLSARGKKKLCRNFESVLSRLVLWRRKKNSDCRCVFGSKAIS